MHPNYGASCLFVDIQETEVWQSFNAKNVRVKRRFVRRPARIDALVVACIVDQQRRFDLGDLFGGRLRAVERHGCGEVGGFGMPRAGNAGFVTGYNGRLGDRTFRLVYGNDIVPMVPAEPFGHVGRYLHSQGGVFEPSLLTENPKMLPREQWSNDPEFDMALQNSLAALEAAPALTLSNRLSILGFSLGVPTNPRGDVIGTLISVLPPPLRDHVPDRYWGALRT